MPSAQAFASEEDFRECSRIHRKLGTTYFFASRRLSPELRRRVDAVYGFVRFDPDSLDQVRQELIAASYGRAPSSPALRAFSDVMREANLPLEEPLRYLDSAEVNPPFASYKELRSAMRDSAGSVAVMMLHVLGEGANGPLLKAGVALAEAMKLTNILLKVGDESWLPQDEMARFGVTSDDLDAKRVTKGFVDLMRFQMSRARSLYRDSDAGLSHLHDDLKFGVSLAKQVYEQLLDKIDENGYDVFRQRIKATPQEKMVAAWTLWSGNSAADEA